MSTRLMVRSISLAAFGVAGMTSSMAGCGDDTTLGSPTASTPISSEASDESSTTFTPPPDPTTTIALASTTVGPTDATSTSSSTSDIEVDTTTTSTTTISSVPIETPVGRVTVTGPFGVLVLSDPATGASATTDPQAIAVELADGSVVAQEESGYSETWASEYTTPMVYAPGAAPRPLWAADTAEAGWYVLHDANVVDGHQVVLYEVQHEQLGLYDTRPFGLYRYDVVTGEHTYLTDVGGWESGVSRLHLAPNGTIVGEAYGEAQRAMFVIDGPGLAPLTASQLGLDDFYDDCSDCPRYFSVSRDGTAVAWLDANDLVVQVLATGAVQRVPLDPALQPEQVRDLSLADGFVVLTRSGYEDELAPVIIDLTTSPVTVTALPGVAATVR